LATLSLMVIVIKLFLSLTNGKNKILALVSGNIFLSSLIFVRQESSQVRHKVKEFERIDT